MAYVVVLVVAVAVVVLVLWSGTLVAGAVAAASPGAADSVVAGPVR